MFKITVEIKNYFKNLKDNNSNLIEYDFDTYFLCALMGISKQKMVSKDNTIDFGRDVIQKYEGGKYNKLILSLIQAQIKYNGIDIRNRRDIKNLCNKLIDSESSHKLTDEGINILNQYCMGGFDYIKENKIEKIDVTTFLNEYIDLLNS